MPLDPDTPNARLTAWRRLLKREAARLAARPASPMPERNLRMSQFSAETLRSLPKRAFCWEDFSSRALTRAERWSQTTGATEAVARAGAEKLWAELFSALINPATDSRFTLSAALMDHNTVSLPPREGEERSFSFNALETLMDPFWEPQHGHWSEKLSPLLHGLAEALSQQSQGSLLLFWTQACAGELAAADGASEPYRRPMIALLNACAGNEAFRTSLLLPTQRELDERPEPLAISALHQAIPALAALSAVDPHRCLNMASKLFERAERLKLLPCPPTRRFANGRTQETSLALSVVESLIKAQNAPWLSSASLDFQARCESAHDGFARLLARHGSGFLPAEIDPELGDPLQYQSHRFCHALRAYQDARSIKAAMGETPAGDARPRARL